MALMLSMVWCPRIALASSTKNIPRMTCSPVRTSGDSPAITPSAGERILRMGADLRHHTVPGMHLVDIPATLCDLAGVPFGVQFEGVSRRSDFLNE